MAIYAALSNNTQLLLESPVVTSWHDRLWVYLKATHERDLMLITHRYRCSKHLHSKLFPSCDKSVISAEQELMKESALQIGHMTTGSCQQLLSRTDLSDSKSNALGMMQQLQAAIIQGRSGIAAYINDTMLPCLRSANSFPGYPFILRVFSHLTIWLRFSPLGEPGQTQCRYVYQCIYDTKYNLYSSDRRYRYTYTIHLYNIPIRYTYTIHLCDLTRHLKSYNPDIPSLIHQYIYHCTPTHLLTFSTTQLLTYSPIQVT